MMWNVFLLDYPIKCIYKMLQKSKVWYFCGWKTQQYINTYSEIWNRIYDFIGKYFDIEVIPDHDYKYLPTHTNSYKDEIRRDFHHDSLTVEKTLFIDLVYKSNKSYQTKRFLKRA